MSEAIDPIQEGAQDHAAMNVQDDRFHPAGACLSVGMAPAPVTALTKKCWVLDGTCACSLIGLFDGPAGRFPWNLHSDLMAKVLG